MLTLSHFVAKPSNFKLSYSLLLQNNLSILIWMLDFNSSFRTLRSSWEEFSTQTDLESNVHKYVSFICNTTLYIVYLYLIWNLSWVFIRRSGFNVGAWINTPVYDRNTAIVFLKHYFSKPFFPLLIFSQRYIFFIDQKISSLILKNLENSMRAH